MLWFLLPVFVVSTPASAAPEARRLGDHTYWIETLDNGLQAISVADDSEPTASVFIVYSVGNRMETDGAHGIAHLTEHAAFSGTPTVPMNALIDAVEAEDGEANAYTRDDMTVYYDYNIPTAMVPDVLRMEADRMRNVAFAEPDFLFERDRLEKEEQSTQTPRLQLTAWRRHAAYGAQAYGAGLFDVDGNSDAPGLDADTVKAFYDRWYQPHRASVVVIGPPHTEALPMIAAAFAEVPTAAGGIEPHVVALEEALPAPDVAEFETGLTRLRSERVWVGPGLDQTTDRMALEALAAIHSLQPASEVGTREVFIDGVMGSSLFVVAATGDTADSSVDTLMQEVRTGEVTEAQLEAAKASLKGARDGRSLRTRPYFSLAVDFGLYSRWGLLDTLLEQDALIDALEVEDVRAAATKWLDPERAWTLRFQPDEAALAALPTDKVGLREAGMAAVESGDLVRAIAAFERLLALGANQMNTVIYHYTLGELNFNLRRYDEARRQLEAGLAIVDYPALRELLTEVNAADGGAPVVVDAAEAAADAPPVADAAPTSVRVVDTTGETPPWATEAATVMGQLEQWRELPFKRDLVVQFASSAGDGIAGYYQPSTETLVVGLSNSERFNRGTMLHEMFHALQDQHFDLTSLDARVDSLDAERALSGIIEGEAMLAVSELMDYDFFSHAKLPADGPVNADRVEGIYRYGDGQLFIKHLRDVGGWELVAKAFENPPTSTAEIYHPERYLSGWEYKPPRRLPKLRPSGSERLVSSDSMGEFGLRMLLLYSPETRPLAPILGAALVGDRQVTIKTPDGQLRMAWALVFEHAEAAARFRDVVATAAATIPGMTELEVVDRGHLRRAGGHTVELFWRVPAPPGKPVAH